MRKRSEESAAFTPAEAQKVAEVSTDLQRDWRRRGLLDRLEGGHARYQPDEIAALMIMKLLGDYNVGPSFTVNVAKRLSRFVLWHALANNKTALSVEGDAALVEGFWDSLDDDDHLLHLSKVRKVPSRYVVIHRDAKLSHVKELDAAFEADGDGAAIILDLLALGNRLAKGAGRPLITIRLSETK